MKLGLNFISKKILVNINIDWCNVIKKRSHANILKAQTFRRILMLGWAGCCSCLSTSFAVFLQSLMPSPLFVLDFSEKVFQVSSRLLKSAGFFLLRYQTFLFLK